MTGKIIELMKHGHILVPMALLQNYKKLKLTDKELIVLIYLLGANEFDPEKMSKDLNIKLADIFLSFLFLFYKKVGIFILNINTTYIRNCNIDLFHL